MFYNPICHAIFHSINRTAETSEKHKCASSLKKFEGLISWN